MSTRGVETRFVNVVRDALENDGVVNEEAMKGLVDYAKRGYFTNGEKRARCSPLSISQRSSVRPNWRASSYLLRHSKSQDPR